MQSTYIHSGNILPLRIFSISLVLYPSVDVIPGYSTGVHVIVNNIYILITGHDTSQEPKYRFDWLLRFLLRFIVALVPILAAFGIANLIYILRYAGIAGFMCFLLPFVLQIRSIQVTKTKFTKYYISLSNDSGNEENKNHRRREDTIDSKKCYMTPYSFSVISHPATAWVMLFLWVCLFLVLLSSLFLSPYNISCQSLLTEP